MSDEKNISERYRELPREEPARALDQAILAAARRAVDQPHAPLVTPAGRHRWYFPLAAAAILVLAVAVTVQIERQQPDPEAMQSAPPAAPAGKVAVPEAVPKPPPKAVRPKAEPPPVFAPDPAPRARVEERAAGAAADAASPRRESMETQSAARAMARLAESPEQWLERISEMRKQGKHEEADKALTEFRRRHPDYRISDAMLKKVEKK